MVTNALVRLAVVVADDRDRAQLTLWRGRAVEADLNVACGPRAVVDATVRCSATPGSISAGTHRACAHHPASSHNANPCSWRRRDPVHDSSHPPATEIHGRGR